MDLENAKEMLYLLADGYNPITYEGLDVDDACNNIEVVRALYTILAYVDSIEFGIQKPKLTREQRNIEKSRPLNQGKVWTPEEDEKLCEMFDDGLKGEELATYFCRTQRGVAARLVRLGKIEERADLEP